MNETEANNLKPSRMHGGIGARYWGANKIISLRRGEPGCFGCSPSGSPSQSAPPQPYPPSAGRDDLRKLLTADAEQALGLEIDKNRVLITNGAAHALFVVLLYLSLRHRSRLLLITPTWRGVPANQARLLGGTCRELAMDFDRQSETWHLDLDRLDHALADADACFVVHPGNPVGIRLGCLPEVFERIMARGVTGLLDLTYDAMAHDRRPLDLRFLADHPDVFLLRSFSKQFGVPGFRIGSLTTPPTAAAACEQIIQQTTMGVSSLSQEWAVQTLSHHLRTNGAWFDPVMAEMTRRSAYVCAALGRAGFEFQPPDAGYYVFARLPDSVRGPAAVFARNLFEQRGVEVLPGEDFGAGFGDFVRLSIANPATFDDLVDAVERIVSFVREDAPLAQSAR